MRFISKPAILLLVFVNVIGVYCNTGFPSSSKTEDLKAIFCDETHREIRKSVEECFDIHPINYNKKIMDIAMRCYPGIRTPITGLSARHWHCRNSDDAIDKSDTCMDEAFDELYDDTESMDTVVSLWECILDSYTEGEGIGGQSAETAFGAKNGQPQQGGNSARSQYGSNNG